MEKSIEITELNYLLQEWKLRSAKCTYAINRSIDFEHQKLLKAEQNAINKCNTELWNLMSDKSNDI